MPKQRVRRGIPTERNGCLSLDFSVGQYVAQLSPSIAENTADQKPAMAVARLTAAAHQREAMPARALQQAVYGVFEGGLPGHPVIEGVAFGVELVVALRATPEG